jgi:transcriptional regulator with XRE-family HTH domain
MGVSVSTVSGWENGKKKLRLKHIRLLVDNLGCWFEELCEVFNQANRR